MTGAAHAASTDNLCEGLFTGKERVAIPAVAKPPFMQYYADPAFRTKTIRITQAKQGEVFKPAYSSMQAFNADESVLMLYRGGDNSGHVLLDGKTYKPIRELDIVPSDLEEVYWSHTDPDVFYYVSKNSRDYGIFNKYSVSNNKSTKVRDFYDICGRKSLPTGGGDVQMQSLDDDLFGFRCLAGKDNDSYIMFTYRISADEVVHTPLNEKVGWEPWSAPVPGPSGKHLWLQGKVIQPDLKTIKLEHDMYKHHEHANIGVTHDGHDAVFQTVFDPSPEGCNDDLYKGVGHLVVHDMETGECRPVINEEKGYPYTTSGTHVSAQAFKRPGWVAMSSIGYGSFDYFSNKRKAPALLSEIYLANTDPDNEVVCRLAHHRSFGKSAKRASYQPYFGEPHATISPTGTRIVFGSDWYDSGSVDTYVIELPAYKAD
ncbi:MAG: hypothetical protein AB8B87_26045 [Granulosicoccus sp.]